MQTTFCLEYVFTKEELQKLKPNDKGLKDMPDYIILMSKKMKTKYFAQDRLVGILDKHEILELSFKQLQKLLFINQEEIEKALEAISESNWYPYPSDLVV